MGTTEIDLSARVARNVRHLREARGLTQQQMAKSAGLPRATWANLETGSANPTLSVLHKAAVALQVPLDELVASPRAACRFYARAQLTERRRGAVRVRNLLPDPVGGMMFERLELPARSQLVGVPHMPGTREYFACETGSIELTAAGERWRLESGDVVVFRGDQRHAYANPGPGTAIGLSVVLLVPVE
jgi:transcriptional regulator with XRE-family HTH domain